MGQFVFRPVETFLYQLSLFFAENRTSGIANNRPGSGHGGLVTSKISSLIQEAEAKSGKFEFNAGGGGSKRKSSATGGTASNENLNLLRRQSPLGSEQNSAIAASVADNNVPKLPPKPGT